jgi:hypothetical protein
MICDCGKPMIKMDERYEEVDQIAYRCNECRVWVLVSRLTGEILSRRTIERAVKSEFGVERR